MRHTLIGIVLGTLVGIMTLAVNSSLSPSNLHMLTYHDSYFTGVIIGNNHGALEFGRVRTHWILDTNAVLE